MFVFLGLASLRNFFSSSIHLSANFIISFFANSWVILHFVNVPLFFVHSSVEGHLGYLQFVDIRNKATMNIVGASSRYMRYTPNDGRAGSWSRLIPNFLRNHHIDFQNVCTSLYSYQQWRSVAVAPCLHQNELSLVFLNLAILTGARWNLKVILICISLMDKGIKTFSLSTSQAFEIPLLRIFCLDLYPVFNWIICSVDV